jgi:hypothetical protein
VCGQDVKAGQRRWHSAAAMRKGFSLEVKPQQGSAFYFQVFVFVFFYKVYSSIRRPIISVSLFCDVSR